MAYHSNSSLGTARVYWEESVKMCQIEQDARYSRSSQIYSMLNQMVYRVKYNYDYRNRPVYEIKIEIIFKSRRIWNNDYCSIMGYISSRLDYIM